MRRWCSPALVKFLAKTYDLHGPSWQMLAAPKQETLVLWKTKTSVVEFTGAGKFKTQEDLLKEYKEQPDILENILKFSKKFFHPTKRILLYEDMDYSSRHQDKEEVGETKRQRIEYQPVPEGQASTSAGAGPE